jgi:hypothetical protein
MPVMLPVPVPVTMAATVTQPLRAMIRRSWPHDTLG